MRSIEPRPDVGSRLLSPRPRLPNGRQACKAAWTKTAGRLLSFSFGTAQELLVQQSLRQLTHSCRSTGMKNGFREHGRHREMCLADVHDQLFTTRILTRPLNNMDGGILPTITVAISIVKCLEDRLTAPSNRKWMHSTQCTDTWIDIPRAR